MVYHILLSIVARVSIGFPLFCNRRGRGNGSLVIVMAIYIL